MELIIYLPEVLIGIGVMTIATVFGVAVFVANDEKKHDR